LQNERGVTIFNIPGPTCPLMTFSTRAFITAISPVKPLGLRRSGVISTIVTSTITGASTLVGTWLNMMVRSKLGPEQASAPVHDKALTAKQTPKAHDAFTLQRKTRSLRVMQMSFSS